MPLATTGQTDPKPLRIRRLEVGILPGAPNELDPIRWTGSPLPHSVDRPRQDGKVNRDSEPMELALTITLAIWRVYESNAASKRELA